MTHFIRIALYGLCSFALVGLPGGCGESRRPDRDNSRDNDRDKPAVTTTPRAESSTASAIELPGVLVSIDWLAAHRGDASVVVLDARPLEEYRAGHIDGARSLPYTATYDTREGNQKNVAPLSAINKLFGEHGIDMETTVVIYGGEDYRQPARLFWVLEVHGHPSVAVLDGGIAGWQAAGKPVSDKPPTWSPKTFVAVFQPDYIADKLSVFRAMSDGDTILLDSRSRAEYTGARSKTDRKGHIPTALHAHAQQALDSDKSVCTVAAPDALDGLYASLDKSKKIYTYCNTGRSAALNYLILRSRGYDVAVYDGSWLEWSSDLSLPVTGGDEPGQYAD